MSEGRKPLTKEQRIQLYVDRTGIAIAGQEGSKRTMAVARTLYTGFDLSEAETLSWLTKYSARCDPPWSEKEILHKVKGVVSGKTTHKRGWMLEGEESERSSNGNGHVEYSRKREPTAADYAQAMDCYLKDFRCTESDLYDASPIKPMEDYSMDSFLFVEQLFRPGENINYVINYKVNKRANGAEKADPNDAGNTIERDSAIRTWKLEGVPCSDAGAWLRTNPVNGGITDNHVTHLRYMLIEFDKIPIELQISFFARFHAPIAAILTSGGSSIHAWLKVDCKNRDEFVALFVNIQNRMIRFGMDTANKNPSRLSRLVGVERKIMAGADGRQRLLYLNPNPEIRAIIP